jgi:hypothetical protein
VQAGAGIHGRGVMSKEVKVLIWGTAAQGPCAYYRGHLFDEELKKRGIILRHIDRVEFNVQEGWQDKPIEEAMAAGKVSLNTDDIDWADVIMFRRYYNTAFKCMVCGEAHKDIKKVEAHPHPMTRRDGVTSLVWPAFEFGDHNKGIIYDTDDNHFAMERWNGYYADVQEEIPMITAMAKRADLITVSTPVLASQYGHLNDNLRVIRNAINPDTYVVDPAKEVGDLGKPKLLYYGSGARMRDYAGWRNPNTQKWDGGHCSKAVEDLKEKMVRVFVGVNPGEEPYVAPHFDVMHPYVEHIEDFNKVITSIHPDIGVSPLVGGPFDQAKSELHWLEYSMAGAASINQKFYNDGPYDVIKDGVDGFLAKGRADWYTKMHRLVAEPNLRKDMAAAAKERVLKEYDYRVRVDEWADAFRWTAENAGISKSRRVA